MIKPIVYHDIREKKKLEAKLFSKIPLEKRKAVSREFIDLFSRLRNLNCDLGLSSGYSWFRFFSRPQKERGESEHQ